MTETKEPKILAAEAPRPITDNTVLWRCEADDDFDAVYLITRKGRDGGACDTHFTKTINGKTVSVIVDVPSLVGLEESYRTIFFQADAMICTDMGERRH